MPHLERPGAKIWHESVGEGPVLLCISGGDGSVDIWRMFANALKEKFTVVMWDRRGFSRSILTDAQDYSHRLETDANDAAALIKHYSPKDTPATAIGNSSGAIIALRLLTLHPTLISYEPPLASILSDLPSLQTEHSAVYALYRSAGPFPALERFAKLTQANQQNLRNIINFERPYMFSNMMYWFEREFMEYPFEKFEVEGELAPLTGKLVLVCGEEAKKAAYQYRGNERIGEVQVSPGEHVAHLTHADACSKRLVEVLKKKGEGFYGKL